MPSIQEILECASNLSEDSTFSLHEKSKRRKHDPALSFHDKHRLSAMEKKRGTLQQHRETLHHLTTYNQTHKTNDFTTTLFNHKVRQHAVVAQPLLVVRIKKLKLEIKRLERRLKHLESGYNSTKQKTYQQGTFHLDYRSDFYDLFMGIVEYSFFPLLKFRTWNKDNMLQENNRGHKLHNTQTHFARYKFIYETLKANEPIFLSALDGKWITRRLERFERRLESDGAINHYLKKEIDESQQNDQYRRISKQQKERKKFNTHNLSEILEPRSIERLMHSFPCQLREDERQTLIETTLHLREHLETVFLCPKK